jgi:hypothetical protein
VSPRIPSRLHKSGCYQIGTSLSSFGRDVILVNPNDRTIWDNRFVLWFGGCGTTHLMVWASDLCSAVDECIDWLADHAPGYLCNESVHEEWERAVADGKSEDEAWDIATADTTAGDGGNYINSWEWGLALENPTRKALDEFLFPPGLTWTDSMRRDE